MKKLMLIFLFVFGVSSVMGGDFLFNQDNVINNYENADKTTILTYNIVGSRSESINPPQLGNTTGDLKIEFSEFKNDVYFIIENFQENVSLNITWLFTGSQITTQELTLQEVGTYYFQIKPTFSQEGGSVLFNIPYENNEILRLFVQTTGLEGRTSLFTPLINGVVDLILINVGIWKIAYYLFIVVIIVGGLFGIVLLAYRFYQWANKLDIWGKKKNRSNFRK